MLGAFLIIMGVVLALGVGVYYSLREKPEESRLPTAQPAHPLSEVVTERVSRPEPEPLVMVDPFSDEPLESDDDAVFVPLRHEYAPGFHARLKLHVNRTTGRDYRKFGIKFFRMSFGDLNRRGVHCYYEEDDCIAAIELSALYTLMFGDDCTDDNFEERCNELEAFYEEDPLAYDNEAAVRQFEMMGDEEYNIITDDDIIEEGALFVNDEITEPNVDAVVVAAAPASAQVPPEPKPVDEVVEAVAGLSDDDKDDDES